MFLLLILHYINYIIYIYIYFVLLNYKLTTIPNKLQFYIKLFNAIFIASGTLSYYFNSHINALTNILYPGISYHGNILTYKIFLTYLAHSSTKK